MIPKWKLVISSSFFILLGVIGPFLAIDGSGKQSVERGVLIGAILSAVLALGVASNWNRKTSAKKRQQDQNAFANLRKFMWIFVVIGIAGSGLLAKSSDNFQGVFYGALYVFCGVAGVIGLVIAFKNRSPLQK